MHEHYYPLTVVELSIAAALVLLNGIVSVILQLRLERRLGVAAVRTIVQLLLIGCILTWVFEQTRWWIILGLATVMTLIGALTAVRQSPRRYPGMALNGILSIFLSSWSITGFAVLVVLRPSAWLDRPAQFIIPLLGMILGNALNGISVGLERFCETVLARRPEIELYLALGANRWEAARGTVRESIRAGMIPVTNSMMVVGLVNLPGMMTGQLLSGVPPIEAVKYQIVIMFLIASATSVGTIAIVLLSFHRLFNSRHQLLWQTMTVRPED